MMPAYPQMKDFAFLYITLRYKRWFLHLRSCIFICSNATIAQLSSSFRDHSKFTFSRSCDHTAAIFNLIVNLMATVEVIFKNAKIPTPCG